MFIYKIIKGIRTDVQTDKPEIDILKMFIRPQEINVKEITYSKEHKLCLVCKGNVSKLNQFTCSKCAALYCQNCVKILKNLENACWVCNAPFDKSKPSKPYKIEEKEEEIKIKEELHPKKIKEKKGIDHLFKKV